MAMFNILILTNMGKSKYQPASGAFVRAQFKTLVDLKSTDIDYSYYEMPKVALDSTLSIKRYTLFFLCFFKNFILSKKTINILHVHFFFPTIVLALSYKLFRNPKVKIITTFHGSDIYYYEPFKWWYKLCFSFVEHSIFVSKNLKKRFYKKDMKCDVLPAGIPSVFRHNRKVEKTFDLIFVGTLDENKGIFRLKELVEQLSENIQIAIVGSGKLNNVINDLDKYSNVSYFTYCNTEHLAFLYQSSKWLVNLSYNESFGLVMAEAMACGVPVVASETDGSTSQIKHGVNGYVYKQDSCLVKNVIGTLKNTSQETYELLSKNSLMISEQYKLAVVCEKIPKLYLQVGKK